MLEQVDRCHRARSVPWLTRQQCPTLTLSKEERVQEAADLGHASLGDRGMHAFMHALACNRIMRTLNVKDNKLTAQGLMYMLNGMLRRLDLSNSSNALRAASPLKIQRVSCLAFGGGHLFSFAMMMQMPVLGSSRKISVLGLVCGML
jgi:hypothetical protein